jgi:hypothetical protein
MALIEFLRVQKFRSVSGYFRVLNRFAHDDFEMTSRTAIRKLINQTEVEYLKCWKVLSLLKDGPTSELAVEELLDFQPTLASAIFRLDEKYLALTHEQSSLIKGSSRA